MSVPVPTSRMLPASVTLLEPMLTPLVPFRNSALETEVEVVTSSVPEISVTLPDPICADEATLSVAASTVTLPE